MSDREKAVRRMGEAMDLPPAVIDEVAGHGGWCAPPGAIYEPVPGVPVIVTAAADDLPTLPGGMRYAPMAEPVQFPAPRSTDIADRIEATAAQIQSGFEYRTLLDCRKLAARLVDEVLTWDAMWPEAEGDKPFCCEYCEHNAEQRCMCQPCQFIADIGFLHADDCGWVAMLP